MSRHVFSIYGEGSKIIFPGLPVSDELFKYCAWWGPNDADNSAWLALASALLGCGHEVKILGTPSSDGSGRATSVIGLAVNKSGFKNRGKPPKTVLLREAVLGGVEPEAAIAEEVSSASALSMKLARLELGHDKMQPGAPWRAALSSWAGPMMVYRGLGTRTSAWDQRKAYLGAWQQPFMHKYSGYYLEKGPQSREAALQLMYRCRTGEITGFVLARVEQPGFYPAWPAACAGDAVRIPLQGTSVIAIPLFALCILLENAALEVVEFLRAYISDADARIGERIAERFRPWPKGVYQRFHAAATPCPRWSGKLARDGSIKWSVNEPDPSDGRQDVAACLRSLVAAKTASFLAKLPEGTAVAAHVDGVYETASEGSPPVYLEGPSQGFNPCDLVGVSSESRGEEEKEGFWSLRVDRQWGRFYAPGRWDHGGKNPRMGTKDNEPENGEDPLFLRARRWHGDPREDHLATSEPVPARGEYYSYTWGSKDVIDGVHEE